jgi:hypothetical protein
LVDINAFKEGLSNFFLLYRRFKQPDLAVQRNNFRGTA